VMFSKTTHYTLTLTWRSNHRQSRVIKSAGDIFIAGADKNIQKG